MGYRKIVEALARYHNSHVEVTSDEAYSSGGPIYRIISLMSGCGGFMPYAGEYPTATVFCGTGSSGSEEDAYLHFLEDYTGRDRLLRFAGGYDGKHGKLIPACSVDELVLKMTAMGLI